MQRNYFEKLINCRDYLGLKRGRRNETEKRRAYGVGAYDVINCGIKFSRLLFFYRRPCRRQWYNRRELSLFFPAESSLNHLGR